MPADNDSSSSQRDHRRSDPMAEHKRRARWRLFGALILVGAVAAVAPMLLEDQARPLSQDLLIEIPSRSSSFGKIDSLKAPSAEAPATAPASPAPAVETKVEAKAEPKTEPKKDTKVKKDSVFVQVGAYSKIESANAIKAKLESGGHKVVLETLKAADGTELYRVRIGPFDSRAEAEQVRDRARTQGYSTAAVVAP